jgi:lysophospholipase L1-like esterase
LGGDISTFVPKLNRSCVSTLRKTIAAVGAQRTFLVMLPMRPMLRETIEPDYVAAFRAIFLELAHESARTALIDLSTRFDDEQAMFNDFDHLNAEGAAAFTAEAVELLR